MTHFSSRYKDEEQLQPLLEEAQSIFPNTRLANEHQLDSGRSSQGRILTRDLGWMRRPNTTYEKKPLIARD